MLAQRCQRLAEIVRQGGLECKRAPVVGVTKFETQGVQGLTRNQDFRAIAGACSISNAGS
jgi:hypothetical protein